MRVLNREFYARTPTVVARDLIGKKLVRRFADETKLEGIIVETEAYGGEDDPASHAFIGKTKRNEVMFGEAGHAYVYFTYGFHNCLNFVSGKSGSASAVLIRAVEPTRGLETMMKFREKKKPTELASGPGKLCQAFNIDRSLNGIDITRQGSQIVVLDGEQEKSRVLSSPRVGIKTATERHWRFYREGSPYVSKV